MWGYSKDFHFTSLFNTSIAVFLLSTFSSTTKKTFPTTQMTNYWLVVSNSSSMSYFLLLLFFLILISYLFSFGTAVSFSLSHFHLLRKHSNMQYCPYWYDRCLQQHATLLTTDDHIGSSWMTLWHKILIHPSTLSIIYQKFLQISSYFYLIFIVINYIYFSYKSISF